MQKDNQQSKCKIFFCFQLFWKLVKTEQCFCLGCVLMAHELICQSNWITPCELWPFACLLWYRRYLADSYVKLHYILLTFLSCIIARFTYVNYAELHTHWNGLYKQSSNKNAISVSLRLSFFLNIVRCTGSRWPERAKFLQLIPIYITGWKNYCVNRNLYRIFVTLCITEIKFDYFSQAQ